MPYGENLPQNQRKNRRDRRVTNEGYAGPERRQEQRVHEILAELANVAHDLQSRSGALVAMVDILQREVIRQDKEEISEEERAAKLDVIQDAAKAVMEQPMPDTPALSQEKKDDDQSH